MDKIAETSPIKTSLWSVRDVHFPRWPGFYYQSPRELALMEASLTEKLGLATDMRYIAIGYSLLDTREERRLRNVWAE